MAKTNDDSELKRFARIGMAACLPGYQLAYERFSRSFDDFKRMLLLMQEIEAGPPANKRGRPTTVDVPVIMERISNRTEAGKRAWAGLSPAERSAEMKRRIAVHQHKQAAKLSPRHRDHPDHAKWAAKMAKSQKAAWKKKTGAERDAWKAAMLAGRAKKTKKAPRRKAPEGSVAVAA